jgi:hypothetical protein
VDFNVTRTEEETYTVTLRDTTVTYAEPDSPQSEDNGIVSPSPKVIEKTRSIYQIDSIVERFYPDFIRLGAYETVGLIGGDTDFSLNSGPFGAHVPITDLDTYRGNPTGNSIFAGTLQRFGIMEYRLRWFKDAPNWTIGTHLFEAIFPTIRVEEGVTSILPVYLRKRFYFREKVPFVSATLSAGFGWFPSQYANISASADLGSVGGTNLRFYVGAVAGNNIDSAPNIDGNEFTNDGGSVFFPYAGLGLSLLDFVNTPEETYTEWKDHPHSAWNLGLAEVGFLSSNSEPLIQAPNNPDAFQPDEGNGSFINGGFFKLLNADLAIPVLDNGFYAGTSLLSIYVMSLKEMSLGILPLRIGYNKQILADELFLSPFLEWSYYPSNSLNLGARINLQMFDYTSLSLIGGYIIGNTEDLVGNDFFDDIDVPFEFNTLYLGLSLNLYTQHQLPEILRYNKD